MGEKKVVKTGIEIGKPEYMGPFKIDVTGGEERGGQTDR